MKHAPAPWAQRRMTNSIKIGCPSQPEICEVHFPKEHRFNGTDGHEANANLIAAAPALLTGAKDFLAWFKNFIGAETFDNEIRCEQLTALRAAIADAEGGSNGQANR